MVGEVSSSNPPPPLMNGGSGLLAPGFRFHPTDEELVSYYLKRKVSGLPLRVDAIGEVDLYKREPWDLPSLSRLRSRDMEWYFFSPLDRKYSNRSRTNRATAEGYWKTTGKDRPIRCNGAAASRVIGMKKTLVFHVGRAPRGERTNWVMHEYRSEDDQLARAGIPQGSFVVCRIFQKNGAGPQNGAQYGAPFLEEEWEAAEDLVPVGEVGALDVFMDAPGEQENVFLDDVEQKQILGDQHESTVLFVAQPEGQDGGSHAEDPTILLEEILDMDGFDIDRYITDPGLQNDPYIIDNMGGNSGMGEQSHSPSDHNDGYLELKDIFDNANVDCPSSGNSLDGLLGVHNDHILANKVNETTTLPELDGIEFFLDITNETANDQDLSQLYQPVEGDFILQPDEFMNPVAADYPSGQLSEDNLVFYDAPSSHLPFNANDLPFTSAAVDDLMAFFDATDNNSQYDIFASEKPEFVNSCTLAQSNSAPVVEGSSCLPCKATLQAPRAKIEKGASSSIKFTGANNQLESRNEDETAALDFQRNEGWNKAIRKRVVNMLDSISAPPAMAEGPVKGKAVGLSSATHSSSSIRVSAGMIQMHGITVIGGAEQWTMQKSGDMSFLLSYGMAADDLVGKSVCFEPITKMQGGVLATVFRGGFYLFGISMLILSVSLRVAMCVYNK